MAEITYERRGQIVRAAFKILQDYPEGLPIRELIPKIEDDITLTDFEKSEYPNRPGVRRFDKILRFSTIAAVKAGWLIKNRGTWTLTDAGKNALRKFADPEAFARQAGRLYREWADAQPDTPEAEDDQPASSTSIEEAEEDSWRDVEDYLTRMSPYDFQDLVAALLRGMGYHVAWVSPPGPDKGLDILAYRDPLGAEKPRIKVQVKRRKDRIGVDGLRSFLALLSDEDVGLFISNGGFTSDAESEARMQEKRQITLVDAQGLFDLWVQYYDGIDDEGQRLLPLKAVHYLDLED